MICTKDSLNRHYYCYFKVSRYPSERYKHCTRMRMLRTLPPMRYSPVRLLSLFYYFLFIFMCCFLCCFLFCDLAIFCFYVFLLLLAMFILFYFIFYLFFIFLYIRKCIFFSSFIIIFYLSILMLFQTFKWIKSHKQKLKIYKWLRGKMNQNYNETKEKKIGPIIISYLLTFFNIHMKLIHI